MAKLRGADIIFDYLVKEKVPYMFGCPGHGVSGLLAAVPAYSDRLKVIVVHHEQAAGHMADAYYRIAHQPVATFSSVGPGSANLPIALGNALMDDSAFLAITGNVATSQFNRGTFQEAHRHFQADFPSVIRPYVKRSFQVMLPDQLPLTLRQAFKTMTMGCPGPVNLDVPFNLFSEESEVEVPDPEQWREGIEVRTGASTEAVHKALDALVAAERPVIVVGNGAALSEAEEEVRTLAETLNIPVAYSAQGIAVMDADHPLTLGSIGRDGGYPGNEATSTADVVLTLGVQFDDRATSAWIPGYTYTIPPTKLIQVDIDELIIGRNYPVYLGVNADVRTFVRQLLSAVEGEHRRDHADWHRTVTGWKAQWTQYNEERYRPDAQPIHPDHVIRNIRKALPREGILAVDVGSHHTWVVSRWESYLPRTVIQQWGFGAMGAGAAGALGAKLAAPDKPVVCLTGDSGFLMVSHVVATAVEWDIPVTWVIWNNGGYGLVRTEGEVASLSRFMRHATGEPLTPDYAALARSYHAEGIRVDAPGELGDALEHAITSNRPTVIDVVVDPTVAPVAVGTTQWPPHPPRPIEYPRDSFMGRSTPKP